MYIKTYAEGNGYLSMLFEDDITTLEMKEPEEPTLKETATELAKRQNSIYNTRINLFIKEERSLKIAAMVIYNITWGRCSSIKQNCLESLPYYDAIRKESNAASSFKEIRAVSNKLEVSSNVYDDLDEANRKYYTHFQHFDDMNKKAIKELVATIEHYRGSVYNGIRFIKHKLKKDGSTKSDKKIVRVKTLG